MLMEGNSRPWQDLLHEFLCHDVEGECNGQLSGDSLLKYFQPLEKWLDEQAAEHGYSQTWDETSEWVPKGSVAKNTVYCVSVSSSH